MPDRLFFCLFANDLLIDSTFIMVRLMGNSPERITLSDLGDVIYYKQVKDYSDQEFEKSRELKAAISSGKVVVLEKYASARPGVSVSAEGEKSSSVNIEDIKRAVREVMPETKQSLSLKDMLADALPSFLNMVRQEVTSVIGGAGRSVVAERRADTYVDPAYIPEVSTEGMVSKIEANNSQVSANNMNDALAALKNLNK